MSVRSQFSLAVATCPVAANSRYASAKPIPTVTASHTIGFPLRYTPFIVSAASYRVMVLKSQEYESTLSSCDNHLNVSVVERSEIKIHTAPAERPSPPPTSECVCARREMQIHLGIVPAHPAGTAQFQCTLCTRITKQNAAISQVLLDQRILTTYGCVSI